MPGKQRRRKFVAVPHLHQTCRVPSGSAQLLVEGNIGPGYRRYQRRWLFHSRIHLQIPLLRAHSK